MAPPMTNRIRERAHDPLANQPPPKSVFGLRAMNSAIVGMGTSARAQTCKVPQARALGQLAAGCINCARLVDAQLDLRKRYRSVSVGSLCVRVGVALCRSSRGGGVCGACQQGLARGAADARVALGLGQRGVEIPHEQKQVRERKSSSSKECETEEGRCPAMTWSASQLLCDVDLACGEA